MKLVKVYANKNFKNIAFNESFNVVLGKLTKKYEDRDTHNLGKTSLIHVIDFLFLKRFDKKTHIFGKSLNKFEKYVFYMEILLDSGKYLIIRRSVANPTKISFKLNNNKLDNFKEDIDWDEKDIPFDKAKTKLNEYLNFDIANNWSYRKSISYFLRTQYDYKDVFQLSKYATGKHSEWKPFLFNLLGFNSDLLSKKYDLDEKKKEMGDLIQKIEKNFSINTKEIDKIKGLIEIKNEEKTDSEKNIDSFNFYNQDKEINRVLLENIENEISALNTLRYNYDYEVDQITKSIEKSLPNLNFDDLKKLFDEVKIYFPDNLLKEYKELEEFNIKISKDRDKYLKERLKILQNDLQKINEDLRDLENKKSSLLSVLKDSDSYNKFKYYQKNLAKLDSEIAILQEKFNHANKVSALEIQLEEIQREIDICNHEILNAISEGNEHYKNIRKIYNWILKQLLNSPAIISISQNKEGNVEYNADIQNSEDLAVTSEGHGTTYRKLLCVAFDLSILLNFYNKSFYKFVYHDGVLEGLDKRIKNNFINLVRNICKDYGIQYILTIIDSDIPYDEDLEMFKFSKNEICLTLDDEGNAGKLFEMSF